LLVHAATWHGRAAQSLAAAHCTQAPASHFIPLPQTVPSVAFEYVHMPVVLHAATLHGCAEHSPADAH